MDEQFIIDLYQRLALRSPTQAEIDAGLTAIEERGQDAYAQEIGETEEVVEIQTVVLPIIGLYQAFLERTPEPVGLEFWTTAISSGELNFGDLIASFVETDEFAVANPDIGANPTNAQLVNLFYENILGRIPDAEGFAFWLNALNSGNIDAGLFASTFLSSDEAQEDVGSALVSYYADLQDNGAIDDPDNADSLRSNDEGDGGDVVSGGGGGSSRSLTVDVDENGVLTFGGRAQGDVTVSVDEDGQLVFTRQDRSATLDSDNQIITGVAGLDDDDTIASLDGEDGNVLAFDGKGWSFVNDAQFDALNFYEAVGASQSVFLLSDFDINDVSALISSVTAEQIDEVISFVTNVQNFRTILSYAEDAYEAASTEVDLSIATAFGAQTSLNTLIDALVNTYLDADPESPTFSLPFNVGLPVFLRNEANTLSANGDEGFTLVGRGAVHSIQGLPGQNFDLGVSEYGSDDVISGGSGSDIIIGLGDDGTVSVTEPEAELPEGVERLITANTEEVDDVQFEITGGDRLTGGDGEDLFIYVQGHGVDTITDFDVENDTIVIASQYGIEIVTGQNFDGDEIANDSFIAFLGDGYLEDSGIAVLNVNDAEGLAFAVQNLFGPNVSYDMIAA